ncbi:MAG: DCC1-like thiol-disulfide oxidoreductase family protein [Bacteroidales bacterium]|nr:DCC1-like thiol-disulfide oxidoreductase family protein [Bacteroidales bacterium]MDT8431556.1 DCC1-like thiol-disulfide oxidoreductase family protein [Bacteroidales bacterium]
MVNISLHCTMNIWTVEPGLPPACYPFMEPAIVFFDNTCVLCSRSVQFIFRHDRKGRFQYASLDSGAFSRIAHLVPAGARVPDSVILYMKGRVYLRSSAALRIGARLRFPVSLVAAGWIVPPFLRDAVYDWIARNRYRWFGKRETCFIPEGALQERVLE